MRVILLGVGGFGKSWRNALKAVPGVEVAAAVDIRPEALDEAAGLFAVPPERYFASDELPWEEVEADALIHSAPQNVRHSHVMRALKAGKHVLAVKPMSDRYETAVEMAQEAAKRDRKLVIAQQIRFHPVILQLREFVQSGALGEIGYVHLDFYYIREGYKGSYPQRYPLLVQGSIHHFDLLRWVLGSDAKSVIAENWNPSWVEGGGKAGAYAVFEMTNGVRACYRSVPTRSDQMNWFCDWRIEGADGIAEAKGGRVFLNGEEIRSETEDLQGFNRRLPDLQEAVLRTFIDYVSGGEEPGISGRNNLNSVAMSFGAIQSGESGRRVDLNDL
jgi:predicted dehydrogenase